MAKEMDALVKLADKLGLSIAQATTAIRNAATQKNTSKSKAVKEATKNMNKGGSVMAMGKAKMAKKKMRGGGMTKMRGGGMGMKKMRGGGMAKMAKKKKMMRGGMAKKKK